MNKTKSRKTKITFALQPWKVIHHTGLCYKLLYPCKVESINVLKPLVIYGVSSVRRHFRPQAVYFSFTSKVWKFQLGWVIFCSGTLSIYGIYNFLFVYIYDVAQLTFCFGNETYTYTYIILVIPCITIPFLSVTLIRCHHSGSGCYRSD